MTGGDPVIPEFGRGSECVRENGAFCWDWVRDNWDPILWPRLVEHVQLTAIAVSIGLVIAFAAALAAYRFRWFEAPFGLLSGLLYTIPSLALFQLLVPITGLTVTTVEIALVSYTLLILFRNILSGLRAAPPELMKEAPKLAAQMIRALKAPKRVVIRRETAAVLMGPGEWASVTKLDGVWKASD